MIDSVGDLLHNRRPTTPPEIDRIKQYIKKQYDKTVSVEIHKNHISVVTPSAALANTLRLDMPRVQAAAESDKKIVIKIG